MKTARCHHRVMTTAGDLAAIETLAHQLQKRYPTVIPDRVTAIVQRHFARFDGRPVQLYVPLLVERRSRDELERLAVP
jgi:hypothetical protein